MTAVHAPLRIAELRRARAAAGIGQVIHYFDSVDSTNTVAHRLAAAGAEEGTTVIAERQTQGRGRLGRSWVSPPYRNLYVSIVLRPALPAAVTPVIGLAAGLAATRAVAAWTPAARMKWPNDVVVDGRKLVGILTEMATRTDAVDFVIVGIGVNLNSKRDDFPPELHDKATSLAMVTGAAVERVTFADRLLSESEGAYMEVRRAGFAAIHAECEQRSSLIGQRVDIAAGDRHYGGTVCGFDADGRLRLRTDDGGEQTIVAGDVSVVGGYA